MIYKNKLGTFTFDDNVQESHMKLIVQNITGQYLNPKKGEPELTDEQSCYNYIYERCGNVLAAVPFELEINPVKRVWTVEQLRAKTIKDFDARMAAYAKMDTERAQQDLDALLDLEEKHNRQSFGGWLVGPAALR